MKGITCSTMTSTGNLQSMSLQGIGLRMGGIKNLITSYKHNKILPLCHAAIQQEPGSKTSAKGELFGVRNLFRLTEDRVATKDIVDRQRKQEQGFRIEEYDAQGAVLHDRRA